MYISMMFSGLSLVILTWLVLLGKLSPSWNTFMGAIVFLLLTSAFYSVHKDLVEFKTQMDLVKAAGLETTTKLGQDFIANKKSE